MEIRSSWAGHLRRRLALIEVMPELSFSVSQRRGLRSLKEALPWIIDRMESGAPLNRDEQERLREARRFSMNAIGEHDFAKAQGIDLIHAARALAKANRSVVEAEANLKLTFERTDWSPSQTPCT